MTTILELSRTLDGWIRWQRTRRALTWSLRGLALGLALSLTLGVLAVFQTWLLRDEFLMLVGIISLAGMLMAGLTAYLWPVQRLSAARAFDLAFGLDERVSTALELSQTDDHRNGELVRRQLQDALTTAKTIDPRRSLPLSLQSREALAALLLVLLLGLFWWRGENWFQAAQQARSVRQAVAAQSENIQEMLTQIEANDVLSDEQKQALSKPLNEALQGLDDNPSLEGSVSVLTSTAEKMEAMSNAQTQQLGQALTQAGQQLAEQDGSPLQSVGQSLANGDILSAASQLSTMDLNDLSQAEANQLADQLQSMAQSLASSNPQLSSQLNTAAQALQNGDTAAAQQALQQAAQSMAQSGQQITQAQIAGQSAQQLQQGTGQVLAAGGGGQQSAQASGQAAGSNQSGSANGPAGAGSGTGEAQGPQSNGGESGSQPIPQNNGPGDGGESSYEQIYAPSLLGGEGGPTVDLPNSGEEGDVIGQGPVTPSEDGQSLVPYDQVYSQYEQVNRQAIDNGEIPLQFMDVIRNYFDSLNP